ncbi:hypothetical protein BJ322DRAFT_337915 [Thelephora terrestris]|uniref:NACHT domain-containing protein n=1 Tax=Thelephora terrestris TaxID=56493 RepID=A0A9P6L2D4_9AGAM|nr:hypothetical protein BJ322DRAFT_337915 [Thelephora terrestris]
MSDRMKSSLETFSKSRENVPRVAVKIDSAIARLGRLSVEGGTLCDGASKQSLTLFEALEGIKDELQSISERSSVVEYQETPDDVHTVCELVEGIKDAVLKYQLAQQEMIFNQNLKLITSDELNVLNHSHRAHLAGYKHGNRANCLKGTRESVLDEIEQWAEDFEEPCVYWLNGLAGTGKSTIAQTVAERVFANGHLGASFFCSRDIADRSDLQLIFPTLAFQLAQNYPAFRSSLVPLLQFNPDIVGESLQAQMQSLIVEPLLSTGISTVVLVDALDECKGEYPQSAFLRALGESVSEIPGVKFFITSRPEKDIVAGFSDLELELCKKTFFLHMVDRHTVDSDIRLFFEHELSKLAIQHGGIEDWPTDEQLSSLCQRAAGLFVYAVATIKFLDHGLRCPSDQLHVIMKSPESTIYEGTVRLKTYASLDSLYLSIFEAAFGEYSAEDQARVQTILSAVIFAFNPLSPTTISTLLGFKRSEVLATLGSIQSLLAIHEDPNKPVQPFHKSFPDFITDPTRCVDTRFSISPDHHIKLALCCLKLLNEFPERNHWAISSDSTFAECNELRGRIRQSDVYEALVYASKSWYQHLATSKYPTADVLSALSHFLGQEFLFWASMMPLVRARIALREVISWLIKVSTDINMNLAQSLSIIKENHKAFFRAISFRRLGSFWKITQISDLAQEVSQAIKLELLVVSRVPQ